MGGSTKVFLKKVHSVAREKLNFQEINPTSKNQRQVLCNYPTTRMLPKDNRRMQFQRKLRWLLVLKLVILTKVLLKTTSLMAPEYTPIQMEIRILENLSMGKELRAFSSLCLETSMLVILTKRVSTVGTLFTEKQMETPTAEIGSKERDTGMEF